MKYFNEELEECQNEEFLTSMKSIVEEQIAFLSQNYGIDENFLKKKAENLSIVEWDGRSHLVDYNGERHRVNDDGNAGAFLTTKNQIYDGEKWTFENALYLRPGNSKHQINHELFHFFSAIQEMEFDEHGIGYDKVRYKDYCL